jgi:hypothetical protein
VNPWRFPFAQVPRVSSRDPDNEPGEHWDGEDDEDEAPTIVSGDEIRDDSRLRTEDQRTSEQENSEPANRKPRHQQTTNSEPANSEPEK